MTLVLQVKSLISIRLWKISLQTYIEKLYFKVNTDLTSKRHCRLNQECGRGSG